MKKDITAAVVAGALIGVLSLPVVYNLGFSEFVNPLWIVLVLWVGTVVGVLVGLAVGRILPVLFQVVKFGVVGLLNTLVDIGVLNLLIAVSGVAAGIGFTVFKGISFIVAVVNSYIWNKSWTFKSTQKANTKEAFSFFVVSIIGFFINVISATIVVNVVPILFGLNELAWANVGALVGTLLGLAWNFAGYKFVVFKDNSVA
jgi:putative flippase GtrA